MSPTGARLPYSVAVVIIACLAYSATDRRGKSDQGAETPVMAERRPAERNGCGLCSEAELLREEAMHDLDEADRRLLDLLLRVKRLSAARLKKERRELYQRSRYGWCWEVDAHLPEISLSEEFERLLGGSKEKA